MCVVGVIRVILDTVYSELKTAQASPVGVAAGESATEDML